MAERHSPDMSRAHGGCNDQDDEQCGKCELLRRTIHAGHPLIKGRRCFPQTCFFKLHWNVGIINPSTDRSGRNVRKAKRLEMCENLAKYVSALMNSHGGTILIHIDGLSQGDFYLGYLDEMVAEKLNSLLERGQLYSNTFKAVSLGELDIRYREYVLFCVNGSSRFVTQELNTCVALDDRILEASAEAVSEILISKPQARKMSPKVRGTNFSKESREIQFKRFKPPSFLEEELKNNPEKTALYIWKDLGLREYLTAFAKLPQGGSYFLGVGEKETLLQRYKTKKIELEGIPEGFLDPQVIIELEKFFSNSTLFCNYSGKFIRTEVYSTFKVTVHSVLGKSILECSIAPMNGILFYAQTGPVSFKVIDGKLSKVAPEKWYETVTKKHKPDTGKLLGVLGKPKEPKKNGAFMKTEVAQLLMKRVSEVSEENDDEFTESCFAYLEKSIRTALKLSPGAVPPPLKVICEAVILIHRRFGFVLTVHDDSRPSPDILSYTCQLGRDLSAAVRHYPHDSFIFLTEVISVSDLSSQEAFSVILRELETYAYSICIPNMFEMRSKKFQHLISAFGKCSSEGDPDEHQGDEMQTLMSALDECKKLSGTVCQRLQEIATDIDELEKSSRLSKAVSAGTGMFGSAVSISGFMVGPVGMPLVLIGAGVGVVGGMIELFASLVVRDKTKESITEAQKLLSEFEDVCKKIRQEIHRKQMVVKSLGTNAFPRVLVLTVFCAMDDVFVSGLKTIQFVGVFLSALLVPFDVYKLISNVADIIKRKPSDVAAELRSKARDLKGASEILETKKSELLEILHSAQFGNTAEER